MGSARIVAEESIDHLLPRPPLENVQYLDERIVTLVRKHLRRHEFFRPWWDSPRLYALLRMLQCDESTVLRFQNASINDFWLPIDEGTFNAIGTAVDWDEFRRMQRRILSTHELMSEAELLATPRVHRHLEWGDVFFEEGDHLGEGTSARVFQVQHISLDSRQGNFYACKRATRGKGKLQRDRVQLFIKELQILRRIEHPHTVKLIASYTDNSNFALILSPVADESLKEMLEGATLPLQRSNGMLLRRSFTCLLSALSYLHTECIRHKDIKPSNIVLSKGRVYLCDFGVSNDWTGSDPVTEGPTHLTPGYCAPEVTNYEKRTDAQDVWSMGRVFCEIFTVAADKSLSELLQQIGGDLRGIYRDEGIEAMNKWLSQLEIVGEALPSAFLYQIIQQMMATDPAMRPKARLLVTEFAMHWPHISECCQEAYGHEPIPSAPRPLNLPSSPQRTSKSSRSIATMQGQARQLADPSNPILDDNTDPPPNSRNDLTMPPNIQVSSEADKEVVPDHRPVPILSLDGTSSTTNHDSSHHHSSTEPQRLDTWSFGSGTSPHRNSRASFTSHTDRQSSIDDSSTQSRQLLSWSSGLVLPTRSDPVSLCVTCNCAPRRNSQQISEQLIFCAAEVNISIDVDQPTIQTTACGLRQNMLHVYESYLRQSNDRYRVWLKTRRMVFSRASDSEAENSCYSLWLPLTDIASAIEGNRLTLRWSDCNQWKTSPLRNNKQSCDCVYDPENLNNGVTISFIHNEAAVTFLSTLCAVYSDTPDIGQYHSVEIPNQQRLLVVGIPHQNQIDHRIACLATYKSALYSTFQVFVHWPDVDLDIRIEYDQANTRRNMIIRFDQISTPNYTSNVTNEPWVDNSKVAECVAGNLVLGSYSMSFPFQSSTWSRLPTGVEQALEYLTDWTICFFAPNVQLAKDKLIWDTDYGLSDVILWTRCQSSLDATPEFKITFRHRRSKPDYVWRSASVNYSARLSFSLTTAEFEVTHKSHGDMLHTPTMTAVDRKGVPSLSDKSTKLGLQFETSDDLTALVKVFDDLQKVARRDSLTKVSTNSTLARVSKDLFRKHSNTSQGPS